jgi:ribosomal protein S18 acetylase RimI-like enzyme
MNAASFDNRIIIIRTAASSDIDRIAALVSACGPYLSNHPRYLYFIYTRYFFDTCLVAATQQNEIAGWCSVLSIAKERYYMHQLGIAPSFRGSGIAFDLFANLLGRLKCRHGSDFTLEFTNDSRNWAVQRLNRKVAETFDMDIEKLPDLVPSMEENVREDLYR